MKVQVSHLCQMDVAEFFFEVDDPCQSGMSYRVSLDITMIVLCGYLANCEL